MALFKSSKLFQLMRNSAQAHLKGPAIISHQCLRSKGKNYWRMPKAAFFCIFSTVSPQKYSVSEKIFWEAAVSDASRKLHVGLTRPSLNF